MNIVIAGGTGLIGTKLTDLFLTEGHTIYILTRTVPNKLVKDNVHYIEWLHEESQPENHLPKIDVFINLAGESIGAGRWTNKRKQAILKSRIDATQAVISLIKKLPIAPKVLIQASAIGYYGHSETTQFTEESIPNSQDFLAKVVEKWEAEATSTDLPQLRVVYMRLGLILAHHGGALQQMARPYKLLFGGKIGHGRQQVSWIHIDDCVQLFSFVIKNDHIKGPINVTAPAPVTMEEFGKTIGKLLHKPHWFPTPAFALNLLLGEMSELILKGQYVYPKKAINSGYSFLYPSLEQALMDIYQS